MTHRRRWRGRSWLALAAAVVVSVANVPQVAGMGSSEDSDDGSFGLSPPVACKEVTGYDDYVALPAAALTCDEKLVVYFEPRHYKSAQIGKKHEAHFTQDGRIRYRGQDGVIWSKTNLLDFKVSSTAHPEPIYLTNKLALKALKPGDYEYDIILRDTVGNSRAAVRSLSFRIIEAKPVEPSAKKKKPGSH